MKEIASNIDFNDGSYRSCFVTEDSDKNLVVLINSWDGKTIKIFFTNPILFIFRINSFVSGIYEKTKDESLESSFLKEALSLYYHEIPEDHPFKIFVIMDIDDIAFFEVVAESVVVTKE
ncbi:MAG: hypothetical protein H0X51_03870 [Parachlamydiaceae bacterium]|nr:hypothetical protein [Parachlamydiaceae bacterium]